MSGERISVTNSFAGVVFPTLKKRNCASTNSRSSSSSLSTLGFFSLAFPPRFRLYQLFLFFLFQCFTFPTIWRLFSDLLFSSKLLSLFLFFSFLCLTLFFSFSSFSLKLQSDWTPYLHRPVVIQKNINNVNALFK